MSGGQDSLEVKPLESATGTNAGKSSLVSIEDMKPPDGGGMTQGGSTIFDSNGDPVESLKPDREDLNPSLVLTKVERASHLTSVTSLNINKSVGKKNSLRFRNHEGMLKSSGELQEPDGSSTIDKTFESVLGNSDTRRDIKTDTSDSSTMANTVPQSLTTNQLEVAELSILNSYAPTDSSNSKSFIKSDDGILNCTKSGEKSEEVDFARWTIVNVPNETDAAEPGSVRSTSSDLAVVRDDSRVLDGFTDPQLGSTLCDPVPVNSTKAEHPLTDSNEQSTELKLDSTIELISPLAGDDVDSKPTELRECTTENLGIVAAKTFNSKSHDVKMSEQERTELRSHRLRRLAEEFYEHVSLREVAKRLNMEEGNIDLLYRYWVLKRKSQFNRPLLTPKIEEGLGFFLKRLSVI